MSRKDNCLANAVAEFFLEDRFNIEVQCNPPIYNRS